MITITFFQKPFEVKPSVLLLLLVLVGAFIRFFQLDYSSLWLDELYSMLGSDPNTTFSDVYEYSSMISPLFFFLVHGWLKLVGYSDFAGRALTCTFGLSGIIAIYFLGKEVKNENLDSSPRFHNDKLFSYWHFQREDLRARFSSHYYPIYSFAMH